MKIFILIVFGALGLILIFMNFEILMQGVAVGNSSVHSGNYTGYVEVVNALPWFVPVIFVVILGVYWWKSRHSR